MHAHNAVHKNVKLERPHARQFTHTRNLLRVLQIATGYAEVHLQERQSSHGTPLLGQRPAQAVVPQEPVVGRASPSEGARHHTP
jgi:hypothetical protein